LTALEAEKELVFPVPGEREVGVGVDEARQGDAIPTVDPGRPRRRRDRPAEGFGRSDEDDLALVRGDPAVLDDPEVAERRPSFRERAGGRDELATAGDDAIS
jgi:hypothetical protein